MMKSTSLFGLAALLLVGCAADASDPEPTAQDPQPAPVVETDGAHASTLASVGGTAGASTGASDLGKAAATHPCTVCFGTMGGVFCTTTVCSD